MRHPDITTDDINRVIAELNALPDGSQLVIDASRRTALTSYDNIQACPGSGKTTLVGLKLSILARKWTNPHSGVCVLTHTNTAKNEVIKYLQRDTSARRLLSYPHFIGTIQDFVHTFLALPYLRSRGIGVRHVDDSTTIRRLEKSLGVKAKARLRNSRESVNGLRYAFRNGRLSLVVPTFSAPSDSVSYRQLVSARKAALKRGYFFFGEMYAFAARLLADNPDVASALRDRFPVVLVDEMQDVTEDQDDLINSLFADTTTSLQKLGDPDQAIFDGMGGLPNRSYNPVRGLSTRGVQVTGQLTSAEGTPPWAVILYNDATIGCVLETFSAHLASAPVGLRRTVKAVGAVGSNSSDGNKLNIKSYWADYGATAGPGRQTPASLKEAVLKCKLAEAESSRVSHYDLLRAVAELISISGRCIINNGKDIKVTAGNLRRYLRQERTESEFQRLAAEIHMLPEPTDEQWRDITSRMRHCCGIRPDDRSVDAYLRFDVEEGDEEQKTTDEVFVASNGQMIEVATIHAVKGETHDATLILETKFRTLFDLQEMLPHIIDPTKSRYVFDPARPNTNESIRASMMKKMYVAASRARHVVCLAMQRDRFPEGAREALTAMGWVILDSVTPQA